jgi:hypothetical protein
MRVGGDVRAFVEGSTLLFDSSDVHEVIHEGVRPRISLIVEVERAHALAPLLPAPAVRNASAEGGTANG